MYDGAIFPPVRDADRCQNGGDAPGGLSGAAAEPIHRGAMKPIHGFEPRTKLAVGSVLAILGGIGMAIGPFLGASDLGRPMSFLVGFMVGVVAGFGVALAVAGLLEQRSQR